MKGSMDMGYYVSLEEAEFRIPETAEVLAALKEMPAKYKKIQRGGSSNGEKWFSWIEDSTILNAKTAQEIFEHLGFECENREAGSFDLINYNSKIGQEDLFLSTVAPFVAEGSSTEWKGEDDARYRYEVEGGILLASNGEVTVLFADPRPLIVQDYCTTDGCSGHTESHYHHYDPVTMEEVK